MVCITVESYQLYVYILLTGKKLRQHNPPQSPFLIVKVTLWLKVTDYLADRRIIFSRKYASNDQGNLGCDVNYNVGFNLFIM